MNLTDRLPVPQHSYTPEDVRIWLTVCPAIRHLLTWARYSDQRDADLMLAITSGEDVGAFRWVRRGPDWRDWVIAPDHRVGSGQTFP